MSKVGRNPTQDRPLRALVRRIADEHPARWESFCLAIAQMEGWEEFPDKRKCTGRVRNRLSARPVKRAPKNFDMDWLWIASDHFPELGLGALFTRKEAVAEAKREMAERAA